MPPARFLFFVIGFWFSEAFSFTTCAIFSISILNVIISSVLCIPFLLFVLIRVLFRLLLL